MKPLSQSQMTNPPTEARSRSGPKILLLLLLALMGIGAVPGYLRGKWSWVKPPRVRNLKQLREIRKQGLNLAIAEPARVTAKAEPSPLLPIWLLLPAGGAAGAVLGGALIFLLGSLGSVLQTMEDIRDFLEEREVEMLGVLPFVDLYDPDIGEQPIVVAANSRHWFR